MGWKMGAQLIITKLCTGAQGGGGLAVPCAPLLQLRAGLAPRAGEGARPSRLITVTQELGSAGTEETEGSTSQAIPNPMGLRTMGDASHL